MFHKRRAGLSATAGLSCTHWLSFLSPNQKHQSIEKNRQFTQKTKVVVHRSLRYSYCNSAWECSNLLEVGKTQEQQITVNGIRWTYPSSDAQMTAFGSTLIQRTAVHAGRECVNRTAAEADEPEKAAAALWRKIQTTEVDFTAIQRTRENVHSNAICRYSKNHNFNQLIFLSKNLVI